MNKWAKSRFEVVVTLCGRYKDVDDEIKDIAGQVLTYNPKNNSRQSLLTKQKSRPETEYKWIGKTNSEKRNEKNKKSDQKSLKKLDHENKKIKKPSFLFEPENLVQTKN